MKLTDLNIDCIQSILEYLPYADLSNVADSNKRLLHAARFIFAEMFGDQIRIDTVNFQQRPIDHYKYSITNEAFLEQKNAYAMIIIGSIKRHWILQNEKKNPVYKQCAVLRR